LTASAGFDEINSVPRASSAAASWPYATKTPPQTMKVAQAFRAAEKAD
jgi:hypothetical protein